MLTQRTFDRYREIAENRAFRLAGYDAAKTCTASNEQIEQIEKDWNWGQVNWDKEAQARIVEQVIMRLVREYTE